MNFNFDSMPPRLFVVSLILVASIFLLELMMPFHALATLGYVIVIFYMLQFPQQSRFATMLGVITTVFIVLGYVFSASEFKDEPSIPLNRGLSVLAIWLAVYFSLRFRTLLDNEIKQKEQLNAIFNNATEGMLIVNKGGNIVLVNEFAERLFGYNQGELVGVSIENLLPDHLRASHFHKRQAFMAKPQTRPMGEGLELLAKKKDGNEFPVEISLSHFKNAEGTFAIAFIVDLSERKKAMEQINREQQLAQTYFELAPVLFVVLDTNGKIISANKYGIQYLGYSKAEILGKHFTEFLPDDEKDEALQRFQKIVNGTSNEFKNESTVQNSRGQILEVSWRKVAVKDKAGKVVAVLSAGIDITEKKHQERLANLHQVAIQNLNDDLEIRIRKRTADLNEAVRKLKSTNQELEVNQRLFKAIMHHFPDSVIGVLNKDLRYVFADGQELQHIGLNKIDNRGERVFDNIHPALSSEAEEKLSKVFKGDRISYDVEMDDRSYTINSVPLPDERGAINEIIVVIRNITERKRVEQDLLRSIEKEKELTNMKSKFVTLASHEFRTPLTTILSSVFLLENYTGQELETKRAAHFGKIKRSVNNLIELLNDFISLGKLDEGRIKVTYSEINIKEFLERLVPEMELVRKENQTIRCEYMGEENLVFSDNQLLRSILLNLIGNAIKYSPADAEIKVTVAVTDKDLSLKVIDHGMGIPEEENKHIFKRFYRAQNAGNIEGTGLGLNIVRKYVRLLKGNIKFQSKLNVGTTFTVVLPQPIDRFKQPVLDHAQDPKLLKPEISNPKF
jgi:PAS domain S-box-containing protein